MATHARFAGNVIKNLEEAPIDSVVVTDTVPLHMQVLEKCSKIQVVSIAPLLAQTILRIHRKETLGDLILKTK